MAFKTLTPCYWSWVFLMTSLPVPLVCSVKFSRKKYGILEPYPAIHSSLYKAVNLQHIWWKRNLICMWMIVTESFFLCFFENKTNFYQSGLYYYILLWYIWIKSKKKWKLLRPWMWWIMKYYWIFQWKSWHFCVVL